MIKGTRIQATNSAAIVPTTAGLNTAQALLTLPTGKTFVLTDISVGFQMSSSTGTAMQLPGVGLIDVAEAGGTAATVGEFKVALKPKFKSALHSNAVADVSLAEPMVMTDFVNGMEFSTCVSAVNLGTWTIPTFGLQVFGVLR